MLWWVFLTALKGIKHHCMVFSEVSWSFTSNFLLIIRVYQELYGRETFQPTLAKYFQDRICGFYVGIPASGRTEMKIYV